MRGGIQIGVQGVRPALAVILLLLSARALLAEGGGEETEPATPLAVTSVVFGEMGGRGEDYFPQNVLGLPDTTGRQNAGATDPREILSLGLGGEIILDFGDRRIVDRPGPDFVVFENPFLYRIAGKDRIYAEPGEVSVSDDGIEWVSFPFDSLTFAGAAGVRPVNGAADPYDPELSGGDLFDLASIGVDSIRYVRIIDVTPIIRDDRDHPLYDITLNGFDLDAVIAYSTVPYDDQFLSVPDRSEGGRLIEGSRRKGDYLLLTLSGDYRHTGPIELDLFTIDGRHVASTSGRAGELVAIPWSGVGPVIVRATNDHVSQSEVM